MCWKVLLLIFGGNEVVIDSAVDNGGLIEIN